MPLQVTNCRNAKSQDKPYRIYDEQGLYLEVQPNGVNRPGFRRHLFALN